MRKFQSSEEESIYTRYTWAYWYAHGYNDNRSENDIHVDAEAFAQYDKEEFSTPYFLRHTPFALRYRFDVKARFSIPSVQDSFKEFKERITPVTHEFGCAPGDNIDISDMNAPITWPLYALVDDGGGCVPGTYMCSKHMADPAARLGCVMFALGDIWGREDSDYKLKGTFTGIDAVLDVPSKSLSGPTFSIKGDDKNFYYCTDCWA